MEIDVWLIGVEVRLMPEAESEVESEVKSEVETGGELVGEIIIPPLATSCRSNADE